MSKKITLKKAIFSLLIALSLLSLSGVAAGLEVETTVMIEGTGVIDHVAEANTEPNYGGLQYHEHFYTQSLGHYGISEVNYSSAFSLVASNKLNSTLITDTSFDLTNIKQHVCLQNYNIKTLQSFKAEGSALAAYSFMADNHTSSFDLISEVHKCGGYRLKALNMTDWHTKEYLDQADYCGNYTVELSSFFGTPYYPAAGIEDWLLCPGDEAGNGYNIEEP
jgi:hypothetical protein